MHAHRASLVAQPSRSRSSFASPYVRTHGHSACVDAACDTASPQDAAARPLPRRRPQTAPTPDAHRRRSAGPELEPQGYTYGPEGRRDPFISLLLRGSQTQKPTLGASRRRVLRDSRRAR